MDEDEIKVPSPPGDTRITPSQALTVQTMARQVDDLLIWTVYESPSDRPGQFVARPHSVRRGTPYLFYLVADTLEQIREALPPGLARINRDRDDDPVIMESWV